MGMGGDMKWAAEGFPKTTPPAWYIQTSLYGKVVYWDGEEWNTDGSRAKLFPSHASACHEARERSERFLYAVVEVDSKHAPEYWAQREQLGANRMD